MPPEIMDMEQGSDAWLQARLGIPTASNAAAILAKGRGGAPSKTRLTYMRKLAGERLTGLPAENFSNEAMARGHAMEDDARRLYCFANDVEMVQIGFAKNFGAGASPDGLIGDDGIWECKTHAPHILISHIEAGAPPPEHIPQAQFLMWILERQWVELTLYYTGMPVCEHRVHRDDDYIAGLATAVGLFNEELAALVKRLKR